MNTNKKIIVISVFFGIVIIILISFVIYPLFKGIKKNSQDFILARKELVSSKAEAEKFEQFREIYPSLKKDLEKVDELFINPEVPIDLIKFWRDTAEDVGVSIDIFPTSLEPTETMPWDFLGFRLTLIGSFPDCLKFLEKTETGPYLIEIYDLSAKKYEQPSFGDVRTNLTVKVYTK